MRQPLAILALLVAIAAATGCKDTEDYLADLGDALDREYRPKIDVYDAGLLIHEALTGIMDEDVLTLSQLGRAAYRCGGIVEGNDVPLCRADAVTLLTHLVLRYPVPPASEPFSAASPDAAKDAVTALDEALRPLEVDTHLVGLGSPDRVVVEEHWHALRKLTGQELPMEPGPWEAWWAANRASVLAAAQEKAREPLVTLTYLHYTSLGSARSVLGYVATQLSLNELPELRAEMQTAILRLTRQVAVFAVIGALRPGNQPVTARAQEEDPIAAAAVRAEAARAARQILDPAFGKPLLESYARETDTGVRVEILKALGDYPSRLAMEILIASLEDRERSVAITAREVLVRITGMDLGEEVGPWRVWWAGTGRFRWTT